MPVIKGLAYYVITGLVGLGMPALGTALHVHELLDRLYMRYKPAVDAL